jgi:hypothetical protein
LVRWNKEEKRKLTPREWYLMEKEYTVELNLGRMLDVEFHMLDGKVYSLKKALERKRAKT